MEYFLVTFIPIFVAVDAIGVLPIFVSLTKDYDKKKRFAIITHSSITALSLAVGFVFLGKLIFKYLNIVIGDFMIAGGIILFIIAIRDITSASKRARIPASEVGVVPLGTPLIAGPAVLTTSLVMTEQYGLFPTLISILCNIGLAGIIFYSSDKIIKILGERGTKALSKIMSLLLAAIAIMLIRKGFGQFFPGALID